ncbi:activating signal cointegrator 1 complex subunit 1-like [Oppia nitens]|uniref:activating signal cointegrator 1 complex subunit 1-like n=1 Tax=Oppia nitens TaxID=1686743 RepID=UPI0023DC2925|nr:activating signal cointegrator 1 complex subunit 1-like [Oppia nitens]
MDIMRPKLTRIGDFCFRRLDIVNDGVIDDYNNDHTFCINNFDVTADDIKCENMNDSKCKSNDTKPSIDVLEAMESDEDDDQIIVIDGRFRLKMNVSKMFHRFIIGERGLNLKRIESYTRTRINIPKVNVKSDEVVITGNNKLDVKDAKLRINEIVMKSRQKTDFTHFVSIPFNDKLIIEEFDRFRTQVINDNQNHGIEDELFQSRSKLHLTVVPLLLSDQNDREKATQILDNCLRNVIKPLTGGQPIGVQLKGIDYMNDDPTQVNVLYAKVVDMSDNKCLQTIADHIFDSFAESGLISGAKHEFDRVSGGAKVKLHVTLMNSKFRLKTYGQQRDWRRNQPKRQTFNATNVLKQFGDYCFGQIDVKSIEISDRHSNKGVDGYYSHSSRIEF